MGAAPAILVALHFSGSLVDFREYVDVRLRTEYRPGTERYAGGAADCQPAFKNWVPWDPERPDDPQAGIVNYYLNQLAHAPVGPPGEQYHYSDTAYVILGLVIERLTGQSLHPQLPSGSSTRWHALPGIADPTVSFGLGIYNNHYPSGIEIRGHARSGAAQTRKQPEPKRAAAAWSQPHLN